MNRCRQSRLLPAYVDRELDADQALAFEGHLRECAACRGAVEAQRALDEALASLPTPQRSGAGRARLLAAIAARVDAPPPVATRPSLAERLVRWRAPLSAAAAVLLLIAGGAAWRALRPERAATPPLAPQPPTEVVASEAPAAPEATEAPAPSLFATVANESALQGPRDELAVILRQLARGHAAAEGGELLTTFLVAAEPLRRRGVALPALLMVLLHDEDAELATTGAQLLAASVREGALRRDEPGLIASLERALRRPDRATAMVRALEAIGTRRAFESVAQAAALPHLREPALVALARSGRRDAIEPLQRALLGLLRSRPTDRGGDVALAERVAARIAIDHVEAVRLVAALARAGLADDVVRALLRRQSTTSVPLLAAALRGDDAAARRDAIELAVACDDRRLIAPLAEAAARPRDAAPVIEALRRIGGPDALVALAHVCEQRSEERGSERVATRDVEPAFSALAASLPDDELDAAVATAASAAPPLAATFADLALVADGGGGARLRAALLDHLLAPRELRARAALAMARRGERVDRDLCLARLRDLAPRLADANDGGGIDADSAGDGGLVAALLVLLHSDGGDEALQRGLAAVGWPSNPARVARCAAASQRILSERTIDRSVERLAALLAVGP